MRKLSAGCEGDRVVDRGSSWPGVCTGKEREEGMPGEANAMDGKSTCEVTENVKCDGYEAGKWKSLSQELKEGHMVRRRFARKKDRFSSCHYFCHYI